MVTRLSDDTGASDAEDRFAHVVQFYDDDDVVCNAVADFLLKGWRAGEPLVLITTPARRYAIRERLLSHGFDLDAATLTGEAVVCDAAAVLRSFMVDGMPDEDRFAAEMHGILLPCADLHPGVRIRIFGEMVDLLCREGNPEGALRLEELWTELARTESFSLYCAYHLGNLYREVNGSLYQEICRRHSHVVPAASHQIG